MVWNSAGRSAAVTEHRFFGSDLVLYVRAVLEHLNLAFTSVLLNSNSGPAALSLGQAATNQEKQSIVKLTRALLGRWLSLDYGRKPEFTPENFLSGLIISPASLVHI